MLKLFEDGLAGKSFSPAFLQKFLSFLKKKNSFHGKESIHGIIQTHNRNNQTNTLMKYFDIKSSSKSWGFSKRNGVVVRRRIRWVHHKRRRIAGLMMGPCGGSWGHRTSWCRHHHASIEAPLTAPPWPFLCPWQLLLLCHTWIPSTTPHISCSFYIPAASILLN